MINIDIKEKNFKFFLFPFFFYLQNIAAQIFKINGVVKHFCDNTIFIKDVSENPKFDFVHIYVTESTIVNNLEKIITARIVYLQTYRYRCKDIIPFRKQRKNQVVAKKELNTNTAQEIEQDLVRFKSFFSCSLTKNNVFADTIKEVRSKQNKGEIKNSCLFLYVSPSRNLISNNENNIYTYYHFDSRFSIRPPPMTLL